MHAAGTTTIRSRDGAGITPLDDATRLGHASVVELLRRHGARCGTNAVYSC